MTKIIKSKYSIIKNFEDDVSGRFLFKMKRNPITVKLLAIYSVLNKIKPFRLFDLLIKRKKKIRGLSSSDIFKARKFRHFYGFSYSKGRVFYKRQHIFLKRKFLRERINDVLLSIEGRLDVLLLRLCFFSFISEAREFIKKEGVLVNNSLIKNKSHVLRAGDIISFSSKNKFLLKRKLYRILRARPFGDLKGLINRELASSLTLYTWMLQRRFLRTPFILTGFPRYIEPNFNSMEFYFYGKINPEDIWFPFETKLSDRAGFFSSLI